MADNQYWLQRIAELSSELATIVGKSADQGTIPDAYMNSLGELTQAVEYTLRQYVAFFEERGFLTADLHRRVAKTVYPYRIGTLLPGRAGRGYFANLQPPTEHMASSETDKELSADKSRSISVAVYLATNDQADIASAFSAVDQVAELLGYHEQSDIELTTGSIFRRSKAKVREALGSQEVKTRLVKGERALELVGLDLPQSQADLRWAEAIDRVVTSLANIPRACIRVGSLLIVKYQDPDGPVILTRSLSQLEIRVLERKPEIQTQPERVIGWLGEAITENNNLPNL